MQKKTLPNKPLIQNPSWNALKTHHQDIAHTSIKTHFENEPNRLDYTSFDWEDFYVDISKNRIDKKGFELLLAIAKESGLSQAIKMQFSGILINSTENRAVLHTALRSLKKEPILVDGKDILPEILHVE